MAAELKEKLDADVELITASGGAFEVIVDGKCIFSKKNQRRFPGEGEIMTLIET